MGKPSPPPAPDYVGAAQAQGVANKDAAVSTASLSNPNINSPYGNQTVTYANTGPDGNPQPTVNQTLTPDAQQTLDAQQRVQRALAGLGEQGIGQARTILGQPFNPSLPDIQTNVGNFGQASGDIGYNGQARTDLGYNGQASGNVGYNGQASGAVDTSGVAKMPVNAGATGQAALLARLQPQIDQRDKALRQTLANQGLVPGGEAYTNAMRDNNNANNDLYSQAALQGIGLDTQANAQGYGQALSTAQLGNQAVAQNYGQALGATQLGNQAVGQNYSQALAGAGLYNQGINQNYNQALTGTQLGNQAIGQNYNQAIGGAQFGNTAIGQSLAQKLGLYNQPLNQITALMSGSQIQNPQFANYQGANVGAAPIANATSQLGQYNQGLYGQQMAGYNATLGGLSQLGAAAFMMPT